MIKQFTKVAMVIATAILFWSDAKAQDPQLRRADYFGFQAAVTSSFSNSGSSKELIILPNNRWMTLRSVGARPASDYAMAVGFLPVPYSPAMNVQTVDTIIAYFQKSMVKGQLTGWKYKYQAPAKEPFEIKGLSDVYKILLISERLENAGIIGKEAYIPDRHDLIYVGFTEDRVFVFHSAYGSRNPKDKYFKERNKEFTAFLKSLTILDSPRKNLLKSPTDGFYWVMNDTVPLLGQFRSMYFDEGLVYRKESDFVVRTFPSFGKEVDFDRWDGRGIFKLNDESRLKPELEKQIGVTAFYRIEYHTEDEGLKKGFYYMVIEDKPGVFYVIRCKANEEKRKILDGGFAADFVKVLNVFSHNRADMPSVEAAAARGKELVSFYYSVQENEAKESYSKANAIRTPNAGKIIFRSMDKLDSPEVTSVTMHGNEKVFMFVYPFEGKQPTYEKRRFSIRVSGNGRKGEFEFWNFEYTGSTTVRGFGGNYFTGQVWDAHTDELGKDILDRSSSEGWSASKNRFVINTVNLLKLKGGFSGPVKVEFLDDSGNAIAEGSINLTVPANEYHGDNDLCFIPSWSRHDPVLEEKMKAAYLQRNPKMKDVDRIIINDREWRVYKRDGVIKGRLMSARVIYSTPSGQCFSHLVDFFSVYDFRAQAYSDVLSLDKEISSPRVIGCDCDL